VLELFLAGWRSLQGFQDRYVSHYQSPWLVPFLVDDLIAKYGAPGGILHAHLGDDGVRALASARTYQDMYNAVYLQTGIKRDVSFECFQSAFRTRHFTRPLLLLAALDDPLHHAARLGVEYGGPGRVLHENLVLAITQAGGHVAWPVAGQQGYKFVGDVALEWFGAFEQ
jgi:predicted alpha/beta-fold hydrolase